MATVCWWILAGMRYTAAGIRWRTRSTIWTSSSTAPWGSFWILSMEVEQRMTIAAAATRSSNGGFLSSLLWLLSAESDLFRPSWLAGVVPTGRYQYDFRLYGGRSGQRPRPLPMMSHHGGRDHADGLRSTCVFDIGIQQKTCMSVTVHLKCGQILMGAVTQVGMGGEVHLLIVDA